MKRKRNRVKSSQTISSSNNFNNSISSAGGIMNTNNKSYNNTHNCNRFKTNRASSSLFTREGENVSTSDMSFTSDLKETTINYPAQADVNKNNNKGLNGNILRLHSIPILGSSLNDSSKMLNSNLMTRNSKMVSIYVSDDSLTKLNRNVPVQIIEENNETEKFLINSCNCGNTNSFSKRPIAVNLLNSTKTMTFIQRMDSTASNSNADSLRRNKLQKISFNFKRKQLKLNAYAKLYVIIATFCILWLPFCILW